MTRFADWCVCSKEAYLKSVIQRGGVVILAGLVSLLAACGRPAEAEAPSSAAPADGAPTSLESGAEPEPTTLAEAERRLEQARADLDRLALNEPAAPLAAAGAAAPAPSPAPAAESPREQRAQKSAADEAEADAPAPPPPAPPPPAKRANPCQTACQAFASLGRASDAVCRLDAEGGQRCARARQIREDAARRVASCACAG